MRRNPSTRQKLHVIKTRRKRFLLPFLFEDKRGFGDLAGGELLEAVFVLAEAEFSDSEFAKVQVSRLKKSCQKTCAENLSQGPEGA